MPPKPESAVENNPMTPNQAPSPSPKPSAEAEPLTTAIPQEDLTCGPIMPHAPAEAEGKLPMVKGHAPKILQGSAGFWIADALNGGQPPYLTRTGEWSYPMSAFDKPRFCHPTREAAEHVIQQHADKPSQPAEPASEEATEPRPVKRITEGVRDMLAILESPDATEAEKDAAASTIVEAVAPEIMERAYGKEIRAWYSPVEDGQLDQEGRRVDNSGEPAEWSDRQPPNGVLVEVENGSEIIRVKAIHGHDGVRPHWDSEEGKYSWDAFTQWRPIAPAVSAAAAPQEGERKGLQSLNGCEPGYYLCKDELHKGEAMLFWDGRKLLTLDAWGYVSTQEVVSAASCAFRGPLVPANELSRLRSALTTAQEERDDKQTALMEAYQTLGEFCTVCINNGCNDTSKWREWLTAAIAAKSEAEKERDQLRLRLLSAAGDDLCRLSQEEIKELSSGAVQIPPKAEFLASCERFHEQIAAGPGVLSGCLTLAQLIAENERLQQQLAEASKTFTTILGWDCLHPEPRADLCADLPRLKQLVQAALKSITTPAESHEHEQEETKTKNTRAGNQSHCESPASAGG